MRLTNDAQFLHSSRYIHLNPTNYATYEWSSYQYYLGEKHAAWLNPRRIMEVFKSLEAYAKFVDEYTDRRDELAMIKNN